jgi:hypothetical protein
VGLALLRARKAASERPALQPVLVLWAGLASGYFAGLALLGNVFTKALRPLLGGLWPWSGVAILERLADNVTRPAVAIEQSPYCQDGYDWAYRVLTGHCGSLGMFARTYGLAPALITSVVGWWLLRGRADQRSGAAGLPAPVLTLSLWSIVSCLVAMPFAFIAFDFISGRGSDQIQLYQLAIWLRSRLIEPFFYSGTLIALALFLRACTGPQRRWVQSAMMFAVAVYAFNPLIIPSQLLANTVYLFARMIW